MQAYPPAAHGVSPNGFEEALVPRPKTLPNRAFLTCRLPEVLVERLRRRAATDDTTVSVLLRKLLRQALPESEPRSSVRRRAKEK